MKSGIFLITILVLLTKQTSTVLVDKDKTQASSDDTGSAGTEEVSSANIPIIPDDPAPASEEKKNPLDIPKEVKCINHAFCNPVALSNEQS